ncbi:MAG TPA: SDR family oxidoreductase [Chloroflexota bacterium]|nr:SDR family oxidoreductase [Chloroflexota bacterium]
MPEALTPEQQKILSRALDHWRSEVEGRVVVITGGARGIGQAMGEGLLQAGARVAAADKTWTNADAYRQRLESSGQGLALELDVTSDEQLDAAYQAVLARFGTADALINNAALVSETQFPPTGRVKTLDTKDSDWETMFRVNVFGVVKAIRRFVQPMLEKGSGSIVNVVSSGFLPVSAGGGFYGLRPWTAEMPYQATKGAVAALTFYLGEEIFRQGVAVNAVMPGHTRASWFDATVQAHRDAGRVYSTRPVIPEHLIPITLFLASQNGRGGATGRIYPVTEWNYDHGYGNYAAWLDYSMPPEVEQMFRNLEEAMPAWDRSGVPNTPYDARAAMSAAAVAKLQMEKS